MINNDGWDLDAFHNMMKYCKMGGFMIFTTKLDLNQENQYGNEIDLLSREMHWKFVTDHTFYRYDKLCGGQGKFSNKLVKIVAYQRTDHNEYLIREKDRLEAEAIEHARREKEIEERIRNKEAKLNAKANERAARKQAAEKAARAEEEALLKEQEDAMKSEEQKEEEARRTKERKEMMMKKLKSFI